MITISKEELLILIFLILAIFAFIIVFIKEYLEAKLEDEKDEWVHKEIDEFEKNKEDTINRYKAFWKLYYKRQFELWKHDQEVKKQPEYHRVTFKLYGKGNETLTIDYIKGNCELRNDGFWKIKDKDGNIILLNQKFIKEVRVYESGNTRGSSEDDKG